MKELLQVILNGAFFGAAYGITAVGLSLIFGTMRLIFFAQGSMLVLFAYCTYFLYTMGGVDPYACLVPIIPAAFLAGLALFYLLFKDAAAMEDRNVSLLLAIGLMYMLTNLMLRGWTANPRSVTTSYTDWTLRLGGINIAFVRLVALIIAIGAATAVYLFLKKTRLGLAVQAASYDMETPVLMGINPVWVSAVAFAIGVALAGVGGVTMATVYSFDPNYGFTFVIKALIALTLGGLGNVYGALAGGIILGMVETLSAYYIDTGWADAISYGVFILILIFLPQGLFGRRSVVKKA